ncbi:DUF6779 domain-containing protein [Corynebacterium sp.]|uniref:DUF6779 domain-containing protein n=1 Tax=Corynebacterium sp. TaxID=1720 RepID=UPI0025C00EC5|nr:DUF6779 domain-containing protein [Corynebacterium sp.]
MSSAYPSPDPHRLPDPSSARPTRAPGGVSKLLMYFLFVLALFATVIMFFVDSDVWMNIAVIAALWAAFIGAVLVSRYSGALGEESSRNRERDARRVAELDAERAEHRRREAELEKSYADRGDTGRDETLESIRLELAALREQLSDLSGLDLTEDQVAVRARAERIIELERHSTPPTAANTAKAGGTDTSSDASGRSPFASRSPFQREQEESEAAPETGRTHQAPESHQGGRRGGFATGTFSAVNWSGTDSEETSMLPLVVDTRDSRYSDAGESAPEPVTEKPAERTWAPRQPEKAAPEATAAEAAEAAEAEPEESAPSFTAPTAGHHEAPEEEIGHHRRRRAESPAVTEDSHGRRRADERPEDGNSSVTVAQLMAQLKKNAK